MFRFICCLPLFFIASIALSQDTLITKKDTNFHSPKKAAVFSAVLPGLGQGYNKKYWKIPVVYAAMGTSAYFVFDNSKNYKRYRSEYLYRINNGGATNDAELSVYTEGQLLTIVNQYQKWRDLSWIFLGAFYALNIVDATVDAYLWRFDVSENLSFHLRPAFPSAATGIPGFKLAVKF